MLKLFIVAPIRLYRDGLAQVLGTQPEIEVVGTAASAADAVALLESLTVDLVLIDRAMPESLDVIRFVGGALPAPRVVALAVEDQDDDVLACAEAGVSAYVSRQGSLDDLLRALTGAVRGELHCSPQVAGTLLRRVATLASHRGVEREESALTAREREIVVLIERRLSNKEIARALGIEVATVKNHVHNLLEKLQVRRRADAPMRVRWQQARPDSRAGNTVR